MNEKLNTTQIRQVLEKEHQMLLASIQVEVKDTEEEDLTNPNQGDLAQTYDSQQREAYIDSIIEEKLERIEKALQRLDQGVYGKCLKCGQDIRTERLVALPYAEMCMKCQERKETQSI